MKIGAEYTQLLTDLSGMVESAEKSLAAKKTDLEG